MPLPFLGAAVGGLLRRAAPAAARIAGRGLRAITKGKLLGQGGGREAARTIARAGGTVLTGATAVTIARDVRNAVRPPTTAQPITATATVAEDVGGGRRYRRMNPMNVRALRRSLRRIGSAEKLFKQVFSVSGGKVTPRTKRRSY